MSRLVRIRYREARMESRAILQRVAERAGGIVQVCEEFVVRG